ncbi:MAG: hypothetical protein GXP50_06015 [Deltaproteobacteria bacterium]|nr:hypothetical protein [Deltaproteobacteria bacterium]
MNSREVQRFPPGFVWQHGLLIVTFTLLAVTGMPLKWEWWGVIRVMGGYEVVRWIHRFLGAVMLVQGVVHVVHAGARQMRAGHPGGLWPSLRDVRDLLHDVRFLLGMEPERARYPRYSYINKFDYWGAFWGVAIMAGSGLVLWFPRSFSDTVIHVSHIAHTDEALLAVIAIFIWHLYHVHTSHGRPRLNRVWLTGRIPLEDLKREHPEEYEQLVRNSRLGEPG